MRGRKRLHGLVLLSSLTTVLGLCASHFTASGTVSLVCYMLIVLLPQLVLVIFAVQTTAEQYKIYRATVTERRAGGQQWISRRVRLHSVRPLYVPLRRMLNCAGIHSTRAGPLGMAL